MIDTLSWKIEQRDLWALGKERAMAERQAFGIDINEYSRTCGINYDLVKAHLTSGNYDFLIIKAGLGLYPSKLLAEQAQNCQLSGIPFATYHFLDPRCDMKSQVQKYVDWVGTQQPFYVLDIESPQTGVRLPTKGEVLAAATELERLTHQQPVLYSSKTILSSISFLNEAAQFRLWIAQYPYDATRLSQRVQYRYISDFVKAYADCVPVTVKGTVLEQNTVLWQFTAKGDGPYYIYNARTADPKYSFGMKEADMNVSIQSRSAFMQSMFGITVDGGGGGGQPKPEEAPYPGMTNQKMINLIYKAAQPTSRDPWTDWVVRAGLEYLAMPNENRNKRYTGPRIENIPNLTEQEKALLLSLLEG